MAEVTIIEIFIPDPPGVGKYHPYPNKKTTINQGIQTWIDWPREVHCGTVQKKQ